MDNLIALLKGNRSSGLFTLTTPVSTDNLSALSQEHGARFFYLDGTTINGKAAFLQAIANAMSFPNYFGSNWDALDDCLTDLDWLNGDRFILLYEQPEIFAQADPSEWLVALDILRSVVAYWCNRQRSLSILLRGSSVDLIGLESL